MQNVWPVYHFWCIVIKSPNSKVVQIRGTTTLSNYLHVCLHFSFSKLIWILVWQLWFYQVEHIKEVRGNKCRWLVVSLFYVSLTCSLSSLFVLFFPSWLMCTVWLHYWISDIFPGDLWPVGFLPPLHISAEHYDCTVCFFFNMMFTFFILFFQESPIEIFKGPSQDSEQHKWNTSREKAKGDKTQWTCIGRHF